MCFLQIETLAALHLHNYFKFVIQTRWFKCNMCFSQIETFAALHPHNWALCCATLVQWNLAN